MKVLVTGSAGRVGRAIYIHLMKHYDVVGFDKTPCSTADFVGDIGDQTLLATALDGVDVIVHTAALHAPHVGLFSEQEFQRINITATENLALLGVKMGIKQFVFTSTTLYTVLPQHLMIKPVGLMRLYFLSQKLFIITAKLLLNRN